MHQLKKIRLLPKNKLLDITDNPHKTSPFFNTITIDWLLLFFYNVATLIFIGISLTR